jgi:hypothetical protein
MRALRSLALVAATALVASCGGGGGDGGGPEAGVLRLTLDTPNAGDGAILFRVTGEIDSIQGGAMMQEGSYGEVSTYTRVVIAGNLVDGPVAYLFVSDVADIATYVATVEQVAVKATNAQRSLAGYSITVSEEP